MLILVKNIRKFLFCEEISFISELKEIFKENINMEHLTYYEIIQELLQNHHFPYNNVKKNDEKFMKNQEKPLKTDNFEEILKILKQENHALKLENQRVMSCYSEIKLEIEEMRDITREIKIPDIVQDKYSSLLKEILDYKIIVIKLKEVLYTYIINI